MHGGTTGSDDPDGRSLVPFLTGTPGPATDNLASTTPTIAAPDG
jgi:hypothetical protein